MITEDFTKRLELINSTLKQKRDEALLLSQNLEQVNQTILNLQGNLAECSFWQQYHSIQKLNVKDNVEQIDGQANDEIAQ
jgi:hypothetical protein